MTFAEAAGRAAGWAGVAFGWTPAAFWTATPAELGALVRAMAGDAPDPCDTNTIAMLKERFPDG